MDVDNMCGAIIVIFRDLPFNRYGAPTTDY